MKKILHLLAFNYRKTYFPAAIMPLFALNVALLLNQPLSAQYSHLSSYPTIQTNKGLNAGITFEVRTTRHIHIANMEVSTGATLGDSLPLDIWYKAGNLQPAPGAYPTVDSANGWVFWGRTYVHKRVSGVPSMTLDDLDLFFPPGTYGFFVISPGNGMNVENWFSSMITSYTDGVVTLDIDSNKSFGGTPPFLTMKNQSLIGGINYYSYDVLPNNVAVWSVDSPAFACTGSNEVMTTLRNYGSNRIDSVTINWKVDNVLQTPVKYVGLIDTIGGTSPFEVHVSLGSAVLTAGQSSDIEVWTSLPNGLPDTDPSNDSGFISVVPSMNGTYTIDPNGSGSFNFTTIQEAVDSVVKVGVCGPVVFNIAAGVYTEIINIRRIPNTSENNTVTFRTDPSATGIAEIQFNAGSTLTSHVISLDSCSHVILDHLKLTPLHPTTTRTILFGKETHHNTIRNCEIIAPTVVTTTATYNSLIYSAVAGGNSYNRIENNFLKGGAYGIYFTAEIQRHSKGLEIKGNTCKDQDAVGLYIYYYDDLYVTHNRISSLSNRMTTCYGVIVNGSNNGFRIMGNEIYCPDVFPLYGIRIMGSHGGISKGLLANNLIQVGGAAYPLTFYGIHVSSSTNIDLIHNNIVLEGTSPSSTAIHLTGSSTIRAINNNVLHYGLGLSVNTDSADVNYNNLASSGSNIGMLRSTAIPDLTAWKAAGMGAQNISVDSIFTNLDSLRTCDTSIWNKGIFLPAVSYDIDTELRDNTPNIGADEFITKASEFNILSDTFALCEADGMLEIGDFIQAPGSGNYHWSDNSTGPTIFVTDTGHYTLTMDMACISNVTDQTEVVDDNPLAGFTFAVNIGVATFTNTSFRGVAYSWDFGDGNGSADQNHVHTYTANGTYTVTLTVMNACDTVTKSEDITISGLAINELVTGKVKIYPNPANDRLYLEFEDAIHGQVIIRLLNTQGQEVAGQQFTAGGKQTLQIDVSGFGKGLYILRIIGENGVLNQQIVVE